MKGTLNWGGASHKVTSCDAMLSVNATTGTTTNVYSFHRKECVKTAGPGISRQIESERSDRNDAAAKLSVGDWVLFAVVDDEEEDQLWVGRVVSNPVWGGQGVRQNTSRGIISYENGLKIGRHEVAMNIMWYETIGIGPDVLEYHISRTDTSPIVQSSKYYIPFGFEMHRILGRSNPVPKIRTSTRPKNGNTSNHTTAERWHNIEFGLKWSMDKSVQDSAISRSNEWRRH